MKRFTIMLIMCLPMMAFAEGEKAGNSVCNPGYITAVYNDGNRVVVTVNHELYETKNQNLARIAEGAYFSGKSVTLLTKGSCDKGGEFIQVNIPY